MWFERKKKKKFESMLSQLARSEGREAESPGTVACWLQGALLLNKRAFNLFTKNEVVSY